MPQQNPSSRTSIARLFFLAVLGWTLSILHSLQRRGERDDQDRPRHRRADDPVRSAQARPQPQAPARDEPRVRNPLLRGCIAVGDRRRFARQLRTTARAPTRPPRRPAPRTRARRPTRALRRRRLRPRRRPPRKTPAEETPAEETPAEDPAGGTTDPVDTPDDGATDPETPGEAPETPGEAPDDGGSAAPGSGGHGSGEPRARASRTRARRARPSSPRTSTPTTTRSTASIRRPTQYEASTVWLHRTLPDPTPPAKRLAPKFAKMLRGEAKATGAGWAMIMATLRADGRDGRWPATRARVHAVGDEPRRREGQDGLAHVPRPAREDGLGRPGRGAHALQPGGRPEGARPRPRRFQEGASAGRC